jgi:hypothetical protein
MDRTVMLNDVGEHDGATYAEPLGGLRVSWGSILAGALALTAVSLILWALAAAITLTATKATVSSLEGAFIALWICAMVTTLIGAFVGGWFAGYLPGNKNRFLAASHAILGWALAFVLTSAMGWGTIRSIAASATQASMTMASATVQAAGSTVGGVAGGPMMLDRTATNLLESLGYSPTQARSMVTDLKADVQKAIQSKTKPAVPSVQSVFGPVINWSAGLTWSWFGTWFVAGILSAMGGIAAAKQLNPRMAGRPTPAIREEPGGIERGAPVPT